MSKYISGIWKSRYFWWHLAKSDLRSRWRRSFFGVTWTIIQPLCMTGLLSIVLSKLFNLEILYFAPYILSGIIVWEFLTLNLTSGSLAFVQADAYIKQCKHPLAIYTLRLVIGSIIVMLLSSTALIAWVLVAFPEYFGWQWFSLIAFYPIAAFIVWPLATILAYFGARFRDIPNVMGLIMQAIWFVSPVYFEEKMFRDGGIGYIVDYNPIYHLLELIRAPLLNGSWPTMENYIFCISLGLILYAMAFIIGKLNESKVIFYL